MFGALGNMAALLRQAQGIGGLMEGAQRGLKDRQARGTAGRDAQGQSLIEVVVDGTLEVRDCRIADVAWQTVGPEGVAKLVVEATNAALAEARGFHAAALQEMLGGLKLPGLDKLVSGLAGSAASSTS